MSWFGGGTALVLGGVAAVVAGIGIGGGPLVVIVGLLLIAAGYWVLRGFSASRLFGVLAAVAAAVAATVAAVPQVGSRPATVEPAGTDWRWVVIALAFAVVAFLILVGSRPTPSQHRRHVRSRM